MGVHDAGVRCIPGHVRRQGPHDLQQVGAVAARHVLHHHAEVLPALEAAEYRHHEGVVGEGHNVPPGKHLVFVVVLLADLLERKPLPGVLVLHQVHSAVRALRDQLGHLAEEELRSWGDEEMRKSEEEEAGGGGEEGKK